MLLSLWYVVLAGTSFTSLHYGDELKKQTKWRVMTGPRPIFGNIMATAAKSWTPR